MKIILVTIKGIPVSIGVGRNCFPLENGIPIHDEAQKSGAQFCGKLEQYNEAFELACWAIENQLYDEVENHE